MTFKGTTPFHLLKSGMVRWSFQDLESLFSAAENTSFVALLMPLPLIRQRQWYYYGDLQQDTCFLHVDLEVTKLSDRTFMEILTTTGASFMV